MQNFVIALIIFYLCILKIKLADMDNKTILPAEWYPQSAVQLTWPHEGTDWAPILDEVVPCFVEIAKEVIKREKLLIVCPDETAVRSPRG